MIQDVINSKMSVQQGVAIYGDWSERWLPVVDALAANVRERGEQGAGVALYHQGALVLNLWVGQYDNRLHGLVNQPWQDTTLVNVFSAGKGLVALCVLQLVAEGKLHWDEPVAAYWPEFAQNGKAAVTLRHIMSHRSGLSAFQSRINDKDIFNAALMCTHIESAPLWWESGSQQGYSPFIYGWVLAELVRRVSGFASFNEYFQARVAAPLGIDCFFGVPDERLATIADTRPLQQLPKGAAQSEGADSVALGKLMKMDPRGVTNRAFSNPISLMTATNSREWRQAQIPAANAHTNARGLASIYGVLANGGQGLVSADCLALCSQEQTFEQDQVLGLPLRFSMGFMLSQAERVDCRYGRGARAFGHPGAGGCLGFADPDYDVGFGYVTQRMGQGLLVDERARYLIDAVYDVIHHQ